MRLHLGFAALTLALVVVSGWVMLADALPEWRRHQRALVRREVRRLELELERERLALERPEIRYELDRIAREASRLSKVHAASLARAQAAAERVAALELEVEAVRRASREADRRLADPATARRRDALNAALDRLQRDYARATGAWPPDTARLSRMWGARDSLARLLVAIEGPALALRDSVSALQARAEEARAYAARQASPLDSLEAIRARLLEPHASRQAALAKLERHRERIREIVSADGREVARCPTCHGTLDDAPGVHPPLPSVESFADVPCTACHLGHGRALRAAEAHRGMLAGGDFGSGPYSLRARIERLSSPDPEVRAQARDDLWRITGQDPGAEGDAAVAGAGDPDRADAQAWAAWWKRSSPWFEPAERQVAAGRSAFDAWTLSSRGRPLRYVGSRACLACHETLHREHSREWMATKFRSIERLAGEKNPEPCYPCHVTGWDPATRTYAEPGVTCEACHGPGERYNEMMVVGQELVGKGDETRGKALLAESAKLAREASSLRMVPGEAGAIHNCVFCHHPRRHRDRGPTMLERAPRGPGTVADKGNAP